MPREIQLATANPVTIEALVYAGAQVDDQLGVRAIYDGAALQLVDGDEVAVLTIENSRRLDDRVDLVRVAPELELPAEEIWWTEAMAPWGGPGETGVAIARRLAEVLAGGVRVEDGR